MMQAVERGGGRRGRCEFPAWDAAGADEMDGFTSSSSLSSPMGEGSYIQHRVSRMDTLAGVAIKYGVEVADIKRMNGLVTDHQMFAHMSLHIPCPGRHPPSPVLSDGPAVNGECTPPHRALDDVLDSFQLKSPQRKVSSAMNSLQGYYGLMPPKKVQEGTEMVFYRFGRAQYLEDQPMHRDLPLSDLLSRHRKSRSLVNVNGLLPENGKIADVLDSGEADRSIRRRQKVDAGPSMRTPELLLKEDSSGGFSGRTAKSLALRPKSGSRAEAYMARLYAMSNSGDPFLADGLAAVRKSSSTSNLQESDNGYGSIRPTCKWSLIPDAIARPIFDGLPKPITIRKNKASLD